MQCVTHFKVHVFLCQSLRTNLKLTKYVHVMLIVDSTMEKVIMNQPHTSKPKIPHKKGQIFIRTVEKKANYQPIGNRREEFTFPQRMHNIKHSIDIRNGKVAYQERANILFTNNTIINKFNLLKCQHVINQHITKLKLATG